MTIIDAIDKTTAPTIPHAQTVIKKPPMIQGTKQKCDSFLARPTEGKTIP